METDTDEWIRGLVIRELKVELEKRGLKTSGKSKSVLADRLRDFIIAHGKNAVATPAMIEQGALDQKPPQLHLELVPPVEPESITDPFGAHSTTIGARSKRKSDALGGSLDRRFKGEPEFPAVAEHQMLEPTGPVLTDLNKIPFAQDDNAIGSRRPRRSSRMKLLSSRDTGDRYDESMDDGMTMRPRSSNGKALSAFAALEDMCTDDDEEEDQEADDDLVGGLSGRDMDQDDDEEEEEEEDEPASMRRNLMVGQLGGPAGMGAAAASSGGGVSDDMDLDKSDAGQMSSMMMQAALAGDGGLGNPMGHENSSGAVTPEFVVHNPSGVAGTISETGMATGDASSGNSHMGMGDSMAPSSHPMHHQHAEMGMGMHDTETGMQQHQQRGQSHHGPPDQSPAWQHHQHAFAHPRSFSPFQQQSPAPEHMMNSPYDTPRQRQYQHPQHMYPRHASAPNIGYHPSQQQQYGGGMPQSPQFHPQHKPGPPMTPHQQPTARKPAPIRPSLSPQPHPQSRLYPVPQPGFQSPPSPPPGGFVDYTLLPPSSPSPQFLPQQASPFQRQNINSPFEFLQQFGNWTVNYFPIVQAIRVVKAGEAYLHQLSEKLYNFAAERERQRMRQLPSGQLYSAQRQPHPPQYASGSPYPARSSAMTPPAAKRPKPNDIVIKIPDESSLLPARSEHVSLHVVFSTATPKANKQIKIGHFTRHTEEGLINAQANIVEHDQFDEAIRTCADGDVIVLLEGVHQLSTPVVNKRIELIGFAPPGRAVIVHQDQANTSSEKVCLDLSSSMLRVYNVSVTGAMKNDLTNIRVGQQSLLHVEFCIVNGGNIGLLIESGGGAVIQNCTFTDIQSSALRLSHDSGPISIDGSTIVNCSTGEPTTGPFARIPARNRRGAAGAIEIIATGLHPLGSDAMIDTEVTGGVKMSSCKVSDNWGPAIAVRTEPNQLIQELVELSEDVFTVPSPRHGHQEDPVADTLGEKVFDLMLKRVDIVGSEFENNYKTQVRSVHALLERQQSRYKDASEATQLHLHRVKHVLEDERAYEVTIIAPPSTSEESIIASKCRAHDGSWVPLPAASSRTVSWWRCSWKPSDVGGGGEESPVENCCLFGVLRRGLQLKTPMDAGWSHFGAPVSMESGGHDGHPGAQTTFSPGGLTEAMPFWGQSEERSHPCLVCGAATLEGLEKSPFLLHDIFEGPWRELSPTSVSVCEGGHLLCSIPAGVPSQHQPPPSGSALEPLSLMM